MMQVSLVSIKRPWTFNEERAGNRFKRAKLTKEWRNDFCLMAKAQQIPLLTSAIITATPYQKSGRLQDVAACVPAVKAAIDGLVDAEVFLDDSPQHVVAVMFKPAQRGEPALRLDIEGELINGKTG